MDKENKKIEQALKEREQEKEKLFKLMISNESKQKVQEQFIKFEKANSKALEVYKDVA